MIYDMIYIERDGERENSQWRKNNETEKHFRTEFNKTFLKSTYWKQTLWTPTVNSKTDLRKNSLVILRKVTNNKNQICIRLLVIDTQHQKTAKQHNTQGKEKWAKAFKPRRASLRYKGHRKTMMNTKTFKEYCF